MRLCIAWWKFTKLSEGSVAVFEFTRASLPFYTPKMEKRGFSAWLVNWCRFRRCVTRRRQQGSVASTRFWHLRWEKVLPNNKQTSLIHPLVTCILSCLYLYHATLSVESFSKWVEVYDTWIDEVKGMKSLASWGWCHSLGLTNRITITPHVSRMFWVHYAIS